MLPGSLEYQTYMDHSNAGADTLGELQKLSREIEEIAACGGFTFEETMMSGDPVADSANPQKSAKLSGIKWPTSYRWM
jgi:hypothetical protein